MAQRPLNNRSVRSHGTAPVLADAQLALSQRPGHYGGYGSEKVDKAMKAVKEDKMSIRRAAEMYGIPRSTLSDHLSGKYKYSGGQGGKLLTKEEEERLAVFLVGCASVGYAKSRKEVLNIVQQILYHRGSEAQVTKGWWDSFKLRHPHLKLRNAEALSYARAAANDTVVINKYFDLLEETLHVHGLSHRPAQVFNCDETGLPLSHKPPKVVVAAAQKHPYAITSNDKAQITILACASASGYSIPPMVIFDRKTLKPDMTIGEVPGTFYGLSDNGWMDAELFEEWFKNHFLVHAPPARPLLLLLDGHSSHYQPELLRIAAAERVVLFCLPPHTTHILQPLDNGVFGSIKRNWNEACHLFCSKNPGQVVNRYNFSQIFNTTWMKSMSMANVVSSFRAVGVFPPKRSVVLSQLHGGDEESIGNPPEPLFVPFAAGSTTPQQQQPHPFQQGCCALTTPGRSAMTTIPTNGTSVQQPAANSSMYNSTTNYCEGPTTNDVPTLTEPYYSNDEPETFTEAEVRTFRVRLEEGYDLPDPKYECWLAMQKRGSVVHQALARSPGEKVHEVHMNENIQPSRPLNQPSTLEKILHVPTPPAAKTTTHKKGARVLTSEECMLEAQIKEDKKKQKESDRLERIEIRKRNAEEKLKKEEEKRKRRELVEKQRMEKRQQKEVEKQQRIEERERKQAKKYLQERKARTLAHISTCEKMVCGHRRAKNWLQCSTCHGWYHCICAGISRTEAKTASFVCTVCQGSK